MSEQVSGFLGHIAALQWNSTGLNVQEVLGAALIFQYDNRRELGRDAGPPVEALPSIAGQFKLTSYIMPGGGGSYLCRSRLTSLCGGALKWLRTQL